jgi:hypothetical protein
MRSNGLTSLWDSEAVPEAPQDDGAKAVASSWDLASQFTTWKFRMQGGEETGVKRIIDYIWYVRGVLAPAIG